MIVRARAIAVAATVAAGLLLAAGCGGPGEAPPAAESEKVGWTRLEPGLELGAFPAPERATIGDSTIRALRIDPERFELVLLNASAEDAGFARTAREWVGVQRLSAAINASMYQVDRRTSISLMRTADHVNNAYVSKDMTILAFDPLEEGLPRVRMIDRECDDFDALRERYGTLVQSIRMISCKGENVWAPQARKVSTAAVAIDDAGRVLFLHVKSPYSTHRLIEMLLESPLGIARAMYVEGGPQAQMHVRAGGEEHDFVGAFEGFEREGGAPFTLPVPNVLGVRRLRGEE